MTYLEVIRLIEGVCLSNPNVNGFYRAFTHLNREDTRYTAAILQDQTHRREGGFMTYRFDLGFADRLGNPDENYSTGIQIFNNTVNILNGNSSISNISIGSITVLTQKFLSECTVVYGTIEITVPVDDCYTNYGTDYSDDFNADYSIKN